MPSTLTTTLLGVLVLIGAAVAPVTVQAEGTSIEDQLRAIGEELRESDTPFPEETGTPDETAWEEGDGSPEGALRGVPMNLDLPCEDYAKSPLPSGPGKVASNLLQLVDGFPSKSVSDLAERSEELGIPYTDGQAGVRLLAESDAEAVALRDRIEAQGGEITAIFDNVVYAQLPLGSVKSLGRVDELYFMDSEPVYHPLAPNPSGGFGERVSEGVELSQVRRLHRAGITGKIVDMAPHAELYLAVVDGKEGQIVQAAQWLARQGVDIINFSGGGHYGPHNGGALLDRLVAHVVNEHDILWVNAAGNEGARTGRSWPRTATATAPSTTSQITRTW